jgi:peptidoglycan/LPS O-acetylase OafA/YrhL
VATLLTVNSFKLTPGASQALSFMRGVAALLVLLNHWRELLFVDYPDLSHPSFLARAFYFSCGFGHQAVIIFFVLSGYLVGGSAIRQILRDQWSWKRYLFIRSTRLYTVLIPALLLGLFWDRSGLYLFGDAGLYGGHGPQNIVDIPVKLTTGPLAFVVNLGFLQGIAGPTFGTNGALWSLTYEFWYYLLFPCLLLCLSRRKTVLQRSAYLLLSVAIFWLVGWRISLYALIWLLGAAIAALPRYRSPTPTLLLGFTSSVFVSALAWARLSRSHEIRSDLVLGVVFAATVYLALGAIENGLVGKLNTLVTRLADSSYTLYLVHIPVLAFASSALEFGGRFDLQPRHVGIALSVLCSVFLYAQFVYFLFEANTDRIRNLLQSIGQRSKLVQAEGL